MKVIGVYDTACSWRQVFFGTTLCLWPSRSRSLNFMHVLILKTKAPRSFENSVNYSPHDTAPYPTILRVFGTTAMRTSTLHRIVMKAVTNISKKLLNSPAAATLWTLKLIYMLTQRFNSYLTENTVRFPSDTNSHGNLKR